MPNMLKELFQRRALRKGASPEPTGLVPLSRLHTAVILTDSPGSCINALRTFSRKYDIKWKVVDVTGIFANLNWFGKPRDVQPLEADLFVSLIPAQVYAIEYIAACSRARFKVGRFDSKVFDLVLREAPENPIPQVNAFGEIVKVMEKIA